MRTINRSPFTVNKPDVDYKFFNHYNWKGLNTNKNYFDIDQETFEDCQDVYMDENGVLKSRPSVKILTSSGLQNIVDQWVFGDIKVYKTSNQLHIIDNDNRYTVEVGDKVKLLMFDNRLLIFTPTSIQYYKDGIITDASELVYVPETLLYTNGVKSKTSESKNLLTTSEVTAYLYDNVDKINNANITDKFVDITINNDTYYNIEFKVGMEDLLFSKKYELSDSNYSPENYLGDGIGKIPMISVQEYEDVTVTLLSSVTINNEAYIHKIYYSVDNLIFKELPDIGEIYNLPQLAEKEPLAVVIKSDGLYCISLVKNDKYSYYKSWTKFYSFSAIETLPDYTTDVKNYTPTLYIQNITTFLFAYVDDAGDKLHIIPMVENVPSGYTIISQIELTDHPSSYGDAYVLNRPLAIKMVSDGTLTCVVGKFMMGYTNNDYLDICNFESVRYIFDGGQTTDFQFRYTHKTTTLDDVTPGDHGTSTHAPAKDETSTYIQNNSEMLYYRNNCILITAFISIGNVYTLSYKTIDDYLFRLLIGETIGYYSSRTNQYEISPSEDIKLSLLNSKFTTLSIYSTSEYNFVVGPNSLLSNKMYYIETDYDSGIKYDDGSTKVDKLSYSVPLNTEIYPVNSDKYITISSVYSSEHRNIYVNNLLNDTITIKLKEQGELQNTYFNNLSFLNVLYASINNTLYISANRYDKDGNLLLYFPEYNKHIFNSKINNLHPISSSQVAVFFDNEIWYTDVQAVNDTYVYTINKSKLSVGCKAASDIVTTFDGKYVIFPSERGLVAMGYQDFVASTEQTLTYLSDNILNRFIEFSKTFVKLYLYKYWLVCYNKSGVYLFDFRNNSWWYFNYKNIDKVITLDEKPQLLSMGSKFVLDTSAEDYYDDIITEYGYTQKDIEWFLLSQKLHLGTLNYHKHIISITLNALQESNEAMTMKLDITNYRLQAIDSREQTLEYSIDVLRTFVKRLNYFKVNQFQYRLRYDYENAIPIPLCIDSINIKYNVTGQVR